MLDEVHAEIRNLSTRAACLIEGTRIASLWMLSKMAAYMSEMREKQFTPSWEHFPHDADIGVVGLGPTRAEAFRQAALALTAVVTDPSKIRLEHTVPLACQADDDEVLLVEWLNALIYEMAVRSMVFGDFSVEIEGGNLRGTAYGEAVDVERHEPAVEVKGATFTALQVTQGPDGWRAQCVVDV